MSEHGDLIDQANKRAARDTNDCISAVRAKAASMVAGEPGEPGDCELCGEWSGRLVEGACARCRDHYHLP